MGFNIQTIGSFAKEEKTLPLLHLSHRENEPEAEARRESLLAFAHILEAGYPDLVQVYAARGIHHIGRWGVSEEEANWITEVLCNASKPKGSRHDLARCQAAMSALARFAVGPSDGPRAAKAFRTCLLRETEDRKPIAELASAAAVRMSEDPKSRAFALMLAPQLFTCLLQTECGPHGRRRNLRLFRSSAKALGNMGRQLSVGLRARFVQELVYLVDEVVQGKYEDEEDVEGVVEGAIEALGRCGSLAAPSVPLLLQLVRTGPYSGAAERSLDNLMKR